MSEMLLKITQLCAILAVSEQMLNKPCYRKSMHLVLGMQIASVLIEGIGNFLRIAEG